MDEKDPCGFIYHCNVRARISSGCPYGGQAFRTAEQSWAEWLHRFYDEHDLYDDESDDRRDPELLFQSYKEQLLDSAEDQSF